METIPAWFWMIVVAGLSGMLGLIMYHTAMLLRETTLTMREVKYLVAEFHEVLDSTKILIEKANGIADTVSVTVNRVSSTIMKPLALISSWVATIKGFTDRF